MTINGGPFFFLPLVGCFLVGFVCFVLSPTTEFSAFLLPQADYFTVLLHGFLRSVSSFFSLSF